MQQPKDKIIEPLDAKFEDVVSVMATPSKGQRPKLRIALYSAPLPIGDIELDCAVLEDGTRVLTATSVFDAFDRPRKGMNTRLEIEGTKLPPFIAAKKLEPFIDQGVIERTIPIRSAEHRA